ncbi:MAG: DUF423 domain-containing protein [Chitinophagaceae bacterium]|nr:DUF423 domain-containing protein [Chitinophagaceae bacterium]
MHKGFLKTAALLGALGVILGAFETHFLKSRVAEGSANVFETGLRYQFYHVFALLAVGILYGSFRKSILRLAGIFFIAGIIFFSGTIYLITLMSADMIPVISGVALAAPLGGTCLILGWILMFFAIFTAKKQLTSVK